MGRGGAKFGGVATVATVVLGFALISLGVGSILITGELIAEEGDLPTDASTFFGFGIATAVIQSLFGIVLLGTGVAIRRGSGVTAMRILAVLLALAIAGFGGYFCYVGVSGDDQASSPFASDPSESDLGMLIAGIGVIVGALLLLVGAVLFDHDPGRGVVGAATGLAGVMIAVPLTSLLLPLLNLQLGVSSSLGPLSSGGLLGAMVTGSSLGPLYPTLLLVGPWRFLLLAGAGVGALVYVLAKDRAPVAVAATGAVLAIIFAGLLIWEGISGLLISPWDLYEVLENAGDWGLGLRTLGDSLLILAGLLTAFAAGQALHRIAVSNAPGPSRSTTQAQRAPGTFHAPKRR